MPERTALADFPDEPGARPPERFRAGREDLRERLELLPAGHPSSEHYRTDRPVASGWQAPDVRQRPDRPAETDIRLTPDRDGHVLDGEQGKPGGGHRHGTNRPNKTEFPERWSDDVIRSVIEDVARRPDVVRLQSNRTWLATGDRDSVRVSAVVLPDGRIWAAWPHPGGLGVRQNPES